MAPLRYTVSSSAAVQTESSAPLYGEKHKFDPSFRGPVQKRSCTDVFCCLIFIIVIISYVALGIMAWLHGDPKKILHPTDSYGQLCGQKGTSNAKKPLLFHFNILKCTNPSILINLQCPTTQICVSQCPDSFSTYSDMQLEHRVGGGTWEFYRQFCRPGFNNPDKPVSQVLRDEDCPSMIVPSRPFFQRCLPDLVSLNGSLTGANRTRFRVQQLQHASRRLTGLMDTNELGLKVAEDYANSWIWILTGLLLSLVLSLLFILLLRFTAGLILWITVIIVVLLLTYGVYYCSEQLSQLRLKPGSEVSIMEVGLQTDLQVYLQLRQTWIILLLSLGVTEASLSLMLIFLRRRVRLAIALLSEASRAISHMTSTLFFPLVTFVLVTVCISYWATTAVLLASSGEAVYKVVSPDGSCPHTNRTCSPQTFQRTNVSRSAPCGGSQCLFSFYGGETSFHRFLFLLQISNLLLFLWLLHFSLALQRCTLAGSFASFYWARRKPRDIPTWPLSSSFSRTVRYHTGSLAFGALILSVIQLFRIILEYLQQKLRGLDNSLSRFFMACLRCCFWCLEKFIRHMNHHVYIMVAIYGKNFCTSAREAFFLLMRNVVRVAVLDRVTDLLLFLSKAVIAGGVGVVTFFFLTRRIPLIQEEVPTYNYYWLPLLTVVLGSYMMADAFFSVYSVCVDTLFLCFCDDLERNDGSSERPFLMSAELHRILGKSGQGH